MEHIKRDAFLYFSPRDVDVRDFAQCGTCMHFAGSRCTLLPSSFEVGETDSCGMYLPGEPVGSDGPKLAVFQPDEVGFVSRQVRCESCAYFGDQDNQCYLYRILNTTLSELFDLDTNVEQFGCCNANTPRQSSAAVEEYLQAMRDVTTEVKHGSPQANPTIPTPQQAKSMPGVASKPMGLLTEDELLNDTFPPPVQVFTKALQGTDEWDVSVWVPVQKKEMLPDGKLRVKGWGAVSDIVDNQGDIITAQALAEAAGDWKRWGNIRLMHDPKVIGHADVVEIRKHPVTGTDAMWIEATIFDPMAIGMYMDGALPGFSIGGRVMPGGRELVEVDDGVPEAPPPTFQ